MIPWLLIFVGIAAIGLTFHAILLKGIFNRIESILQEFQVSVERATKLNSIKNTPGECVSAVGQDTQKLWVERLAYLREKARRRDERKRRLIESISKISIDEGRFK